MNRKCVIERLESRRLLARRRILPVAQNIVEEQAIARVAEFAPAPILAAADQAMNLMIIGDSIASGISQADIDIQNSRNGTNYPSRDSFRTEIWDLIQTEFANPPDVSFVGSSMYNSSGLPTKAKAHSAYRGYESGSFFPSRTDPEGTVNNSNADADGWGTFVVDIALVLLGTNDVFNGRAISSLEDDLQDIVGVFRSDNPDVKILIGTLPPYASRQNAGRIPAANAMIRDLINADGAIGWTGSTARSPITIIDHYNGEGNNPAFNVSLHTADDLHPNPAGEALLANNWWTGLFPILSDVVEPPPPPTVTLTGTASAREGDTKSFSFATDNTGQGPFVLGGRSCGVNGSLANLSFNSATGAGSFNCKFGDGPAGSTVSVRVTDSAGISSNTDTISVTVANVAPTVTLTGAATTNEGNTTRFSLRAHDPGQDTFVLSSRTCGANGSLSNLSFNGTTGAGSFDCRFADGPASSTVSVRVADSDGASSNTDAISVTVANVSPAVTLTGVATAKEGDTKTYSFVTSDPGEDKFVLSSRSCGASGSLSNLSFNSTTGIGSFDCTFVGGVASSVVSVRVTDSDGASSNTDTITVTVDVVPTVTLIAPAAIMSPAIYPNASSGVEMTTLVEGMAPLELVVTRSEASTTLPLTVRYSMSGSATNGQDYAFLDGNVIIPGGATSVSIVLDLTQDATPELVESVRFTLDEDSSYQLVGNISVEYEVWDDDAPPTPLSTPNDSTALDQVSMADIVLSNDLETLYAQMIAEGVLGFSNLRLQTES